MLDDALFVSATLHARPVTVVGTTITMYFRELPAIEFIRFHDGQSVPDPEARAGAAARLVAAAISNPDGTPAITYDKALTLKSPALTAILAEIMKVNGGTPGKA